MLFVATKMIGKKFPSLLVLLLYPGSLIRDPGSGMDKNQDSGSGINISDPQHGCKPGLLSLGMNSVAVATNANSSVLPLIFILVRRKYLFVINTKQFLIKPPPFHIFLHSMG
jgi:hypothetical protein